MNKILDHLMDYFWAYVLIIMIGLMSYGYITYNPLKEYDESCNYCGYENATDINFNSNYGFLNQVKLTNIECDNKHIIDIYSGSYGNDKWGNKVFNDEEIIFC